MKRKIIPEDVLMDRALLQSEEDHDREVQVINYVMSTKKEAVTLLMKTLKLHKYDLTVPENYREGASAGVDDTPKSKRPIAQENRLKK